jgi:hypothetical protein
VQFELPPKKGGSLLFEQIDFHMALRMRLGLLEAFYICRLKGVFLAFEAYSTEFSMHRKRGVLFTSPFFLNRRRGFLFG